MIPVWRNVLWSHIQAILAFLILTSCHPSPRNMTAISGKTVFGDLAMESVHIEIYSWNKNGWEYLSDTRSGYHGSFRIHLTPGIYRLMASTTLRMGEEELPLSGVIENLLVREAERRIDQVVIKMLPQE